MATPIASSFVQAIFPGGFLSAARAGRRFLEIGHRMGSSTSVAAASFSASHAAVFKAVKTSTVT